MAVDFIEQKNLPRETRTDPSFGGTSLKDSVRRHSELKVIDFEDDKEKKKRTFSI